MIFDSEADFENAVIENLKQYGWDDAGGVIEYPTEDELIKNWADILFENNKSIDRLNGQPLSEGEMAQVLEQVRELKTPIALNEFINGKTVAIKRDNPNDQAHFGKEVSLKIFDRAEIAGGQSRYQIARQPKFSKRSKLLNDRRGDVMLLINGMPLIHIELKKSGVNVMQAANQIEKYAHEGVFTGLFYLTQVFVAMTPEETLYFANPGPDNAFNLHYYFHWADFNNEPINYWKDVIQHLLSIPMAHQLIGFYTVADDADGALKVMRSYQYYAASKISDKVVKINRDKAWGAKGTMGGFIWHTTGSGKTMTSFKSAQLIANSKDADKVVFLVDRIELGTQSLGEYRSFADKTESVQGTENTDVLKAKLKSSDPADMLIVTSIQKMSNIDEDSMRAADLEKIRDKRIVFIVDECHRSTFGEMLLTIKQTFPAAVFFGFTGTPIHEENQKKSNTTVDIFGPELHRYSIADGIRDGNVLGFDPYMVTTFKDSDVRKQVALHEAKADSEDELWNDPNKEQVFFYYMDSSQVPMASEEDVLGKKTKGIEDYLPEVQYAVIGSGEFSQHQQAVVEDIKSQWRILSRGGKFHAIFGTHSIPEAIQYYQLIKEQIPEMSVTALFDSNIDNNGGHALAKEDGLIEILEDYNDRFGKDFGIATHAAFKRDVSARLAHKKPYINLENHPEERIDLLIVVDQMLTGFDSKWINTLYLDKVLRYEMIIQAFSRTNRLFKGDEKPFGIIRYYRRPHTMTKNIEDAVRLYSGDKPFGLFAQKLPGNLKDLNRVYEDIKELFDIDGIQNFDRLPDKVASKGKFAALFKELNELYEASRLQGFTWNEHTYVFDQEDGEKESIHVLIDELVYTTLAQRYKELATTPVDPTNPVGPGVVPEVPYEIDSYLTEIDTGRIDTAYMNANFEKWLKALHQDGEAGEATEKALVALHKSFASLSQDEQKYATLFIHDVQSGDVVVDPNKTFRDYVTEYQKQAKDEQIASAAEKLGVDEELLEEMMLARLSEENLNEFGRFDRLMQSADLDRAQAFIEEMEGTSIPRFKVRMRLDTLLRKFILQNGIDF